MGYEIISRYSSDRLNCIVYFNGDDHLIKIIILYKDVHDSNSII